MVSKINWLHPKFIVTLVAVKIVALVGFFMFESGLIYLGERQTLAEEGQPLAAEMSKPAEVVVDEEKPEDQKTYLEKLLELPKVSGDSLKKSEVSHYLDIISRKKGQAEERISTLSKREKALKKLERTIENKIRRLEEERQFFAESVQKEKKMKADRLNDLIAIYKKMGVKKAAPVFEKMDKDLVVHLFKNMPVKQTMGILQQMKAEKSVELTEYYGRIKSGKEYDLLKEVNRSLVDEFKNECKDNKNMKTASNK